MNNSLLYLWMLSTKIGILRIQFIDVNNESRSASVLFIRAQFLCIVSIPATSFLSTLSTTIKCLWTTFITNRYIISIFLALNVFCIFCYDLFSCFFCYLSISNEYLVFLVRKFYINCLKVFAIGMEIVQWKSFSILPIQVIQPEPFTFTGLPLTLLIIGNI